jgi:hypothetical protein
MDLDLVAMRAECEQLLDRLDAVPAWPDLRAVYMDLAPIVGQIQGAVSTRRREIGETAQVREAEAALERLKASSRQVGADIRLASESALAIGLRTALNEALGAIEQLETSLS